MKKLVMSGVLATLLASPAFAQADPSLMGPVLRPVAAEAPAATPRAHPARVRRETVGASSYAGATAMPYGALERDPDPNIQFQLNRESEQGEW